jgi:hypothetical protein
MIRPFVWGETGRNKPVICVGREGECFFGEDWTGQISLNRFDKSDFSSIEFHGAFAVTQATSSERTEAAIAAIGAAAGKIRV